MQIHAATACLPGLSHANAVRSICAGLHEDGLPGPLSPAKIQLCPQHPSRITDEGVDNLKSEHPQIEFRLHASVRLAGHVEQTLPKRLIWDASNTHHKNLWFEEAARISRRLGAPAYTLHAGSRSNASLQQMADNVRMLADSFDCRVGVEGLYPVTGDLWHISSWEDYAWLLDSDLDYALDLSHLNILVHRSKTRNDVLVSELIENPHCIEIHVSTNDGRSDEHRPVPANSPWWMPILERTPTTADVFSEGNQYRLRKEAQ